MDELTKALSIELWVLIAYTLWCTCLTLVLAIGRSMSQGGTKWAIGNRHTSFDFPPWVTRCARAHTNALENLVPFGFIILALYLTGRDNTMTSWTALFFLGARIAHSITYLLGLTPLRTLFHILSIIALAVLASVFLGG